MAKHVLHGATVVMGLTSVDLSNRLESIEFNVGVGNAGVTAFADDWEQYLPNQLKLVWVEVRALLIILWLRFVPGKLYLNYQVSRKI